MTRPNRRTKLINKRGDRKGESNDSPGIPDKGKTSDIQGLLHSERTKVKVNQKIKRCVCVCVCDGDGEGGGGWGWGQDQADYRLVVYILN